MNIFKISCIFTAVLCFYLFTMLFFTPQSFFADLGIEGTESAYFVARRAGMLMLGVSVLMFFARNVPPSQARQAISLSICATMLGLAFAGTYEFTRGFLGNDILIAIVLELILFVTFLYHWFSNKQQLKAG